MAEQTQSEDMVIVLDASYSMFRTAFKTRSRLMEGLYAIEQILIKKNKIDDKDRFDAVFFGKTAKGLNTMVFTPQEIISFYKDNLEFSKNSYIEHGLSQALRSIINQQRFIGQKLDRILIIADGLIELDKQNPIDMAKIAKDLGIIIDVIRFGPAQIPGNLLKKLCDITGGKYYYVADESDLAEAIEEVSQKKKLLHKTIFDKDKEESPLTQELLYEIAADPLKIEDLTEEQKEQAIYNYQVVEEDEESDGEGGAPKKKALNKQIVCTICYSNKDMKTNVSFLGSGRFCPNCLAPFHLNCAIEWSKQQQKKKLLDKRYLTFRCPHCFYLMRIPYVDIEQGPINSTLSESPKFVKKPSSSIDPEDLFCSNPECSALIDPETESEVYQCTACNAVYHIDCAVSLWEKDKRCAYCGKRVELVK